MGGSSCSAFGKCKPFVHWEYPKHLFSVHGRRENNSLEKLYFTRVEICAIPKIQIFTMK